MRFTEIERMLKQDGWYRKNGRGSHQYYIHPIKPGKIAIPNHPGDIDKKIVKNILKAAGLL